uniref:Uncharacterized protein n=1 Tax=Anguilla anguilla TaxID=7936 RepID=A0A0E9V3H6_ANGAN
MGMLHRNMNHYLFISIDGLLSPTVPQRLKTFLFSSFF